MKQLKYNKVPVIVLLVMCAILLIVGIVFALLPEDVYISWGDFESESTRYYPLIFCGIFDVILLLIIWAMAASQKKTVDRVNAIVQSLGDDAIVLNGSIVDREGDRENARKTTLSIIGGILSSLILGIGFYKVYRNDNARYFVLYSEGMYILNMRDKTQMQLNKSNVSDIRITEKRNSLVVEIMSSYVTFTVSTRGLDLSVEELIAKIKEALTNPMPNSF